MGDGSSQHDHATPALSPAVFAFIAAGLAALVVAAFWPALSAELLRYDDQHLLINNDHYRGFAPENLRWMFTSTLLGHYQPLTWLSYALDYSLGGMDPRVYHLTNVALHAVNAVLVFALALRLLTLARGDHSRTAAPPTPVPRQSSAAYTTVAAAFAAAFFAVHPLRVESVAWATERRDVLSAMFLLGAALAYLRAVNIGRPGVRSIPMYGVCVALLAMSLLSKAWGMSFFVLMLVVDWYPLGRLRRESYVRDGVGLIVEKAPMVALGLAAAAMAGYAQNSAMAAKTLDHWGVMERVVQSFYGLAFYVRATVWPFGLSPLYQLPNHVDPFEPRYLAACALVFAGLAAAVGLARRVPAILACAIVYAVCVAPVLGVFQSGDQFVADRYSYLACIPWAVLLAGGGLAIVRRTHDRRLAPALGVAAGVAVVGLSVLTFVQSTHWRTTESLWRRGTVAEPGAMVWTNLGLELEHQERTEEALKAYLQAVQYDETDGRAWYAMGNAFRKLGDPVKAEAALKQAAEYMPQRFMPLVNLGSLYLNELRRPHDAVRVCRQAVADIEAGGRRPLSAMPYLALGNALKATGDLAAARQAYAKALPYEETRRFAEQELRKLDEQTGE